MQTHQQQYANLAWDKVAAIAPDKAVSPGAEYRREATRFPARVLQSGLAQALMFVLANGKDGAQRFLVDLCAVLQAIHGGASTPTERARDIVQADVSAYQRHTRQTLAAAVWFKRLAEIELKEQQPANTANQETP
jgi:CRISPR/Cas system CMR-associated protein Cmr5 small subunit